MNRRIVAIMLAVLLAVLGTTAVLFYVNKADARALEGQKAVSVLVAKQPIPAGTTAKLAKAVLSPERMPAASVPSDALSRIDDDIAELVTSTDLAPGELLTRRMLVQESKQSSIVLPAGKLGVTIPVDAGSLGKVPLKPGFKVAVFNTFTVGENKNGFIPSGEQLAFGDDKNQATRLVLAKVEVISVVADKVKSEGKSSASSGFGRHLVTVAVSQSEAERLIHLMNTGKISLAQVNDESSIKRGPGVDTRNLFANGE